MKFLKWIAILVTILIALYCIGELQRHSIQLETLETLQAGMPFRELLYMGYSPYIEGKMVYNGREASYYTFRSSSGYGGPKSIDFGVVVNEHGIIEAVVKLSGIEDLRNWQRFVETGRM